MKHIHVHQKNDWLYEFRPVLILIFGALGLWNPTHSGDLHMYRLGQICGFILLVFAMKIWLWRKEYRSQRRHQ